MATKPAKATGIPHRSGGEIQQRGEKTLTTNHGVPVSANQNSLKAGRPGPTLLEDFVLRVLGFHLADAGIDARS